jgi:cation diffusion facilitator CzcD-associated flavoprotein CzcO
MSDLYSSLVSSIRSLASKQKSTPPKMAPSAMPIANGITGTNGNGLNGEVSAPSESYKVLPQYHSKPSKLRVACVGAGASGLCLAYKMERMLSPETWDLTLYEKNSQFGGTWYENTYPGVACDIPSHLYTFSWDPNPHWSHYFAYGPEIQKYFEGFADRHGSHKYMKLNTKIVEARWDEDAGKWTIVLENQQTGEKYEDWCHVLVNGSGILNNWKWPEIEGLHDFKGTLMHSAKWNHEVDFKGKTVGVIGTGSTSVQIVPQLQKEVKTLEVFMRSSTWISPPFGGGKCHSTTTKFSGKLTIFDRCSWGIAGGQRARRETIYIHRERQEEVHRRPQIPSTIPKKD